MPITSICVRVSAISHTYYCSKKSPALRGFSKLINLLVCHQPVCSSIPVGCLQPYHHHRPICCYRVAASHFTHEHRDDPSNRQSYLHQWFHISLMHLSLYAKYQRSLPRYVLPDRSCDQ